MYKKKRRLIVILTLLSVVLLALYLIGKSSVTKAALTLETNPKAIVLINDRVSGETPLTLERASGELRIKLLPKEDSSLLPYETTLSLTPQVKTIVRHSFGLNPEDSSTEIISFEKESSEKAFLTIVTKPSESAVFVNDTQVAASSSKVEVPAAAATVLLSSARHISKTIDIIPAKGFNLTLYVELAKQKHAVTTTPEVLPYKILRNTIVRREPSFGSIEVGALKVGEEVDGVDRDERNEWLKVSSENASGWILLRDASLSEGATN